MNQSNYKSWGVLLHGVIKKQQAKENRIILCVYTQWKSTKRWRMLTLRIIMKQPVKNEQIKRKQTCSLCFVSVFKF